MKVCFFDIHNFEKKLYQDLNPEKFFEMEFLNEKLNCENAVKAKGASIVSAFVNDTLDESTLKCLKQNGTKLLALRCSGYNHVNLKAAAEHGIRVVYVPDYSPHSVAEHAVALILTLNRKTHKAYLRVKDRNFSIDGLIGFDLNQKTVGVIGTGKIGKTFAKIMKGFGCEVLCFDKSPDLIWEKEVGAKYTAIEKLLSKSDIISLHLPLTLETRHLINKGRLALMKNHAMLINTGRGALIDSEALLEALQNGKIGSVGLDVYEMEKGLFFQDHSEEILKDDLLVKLLACPNVLITGHQGFLTQEALDQIAGTTINSMKEFLLGMNLSHEVKWSC